MAILPDSCYFFPETCQLLPFCGSILGGIVKPQSARKTRKYTDPSDTIPHSDQVDRTRVPEANAFLIERHQPKLFDTPYHHHTSIELNYLQDCEMKYSFSGQKAHVLPNQLTVFWGAAPHRVIDVVGKGQITNIYLSLGQFIRWGLPSSLVNAVLSGHVISCSSPAADDRLFMDRLYQERDKTHPAWRRMHLTEIETKLRRMALEGWQTILENNEGSKTLTISTRSMLRVEAMLKFIANNYTIPITVTDIANAANLSVGRAGHLFRDVMGVSLKQQILRARLSHSRMLLTETDAKIASIAMDSGFSSTSAFYDAFVKTMGVSPAKYRENGRQSSVKP